jgi:hypothetical protein
MKRALLLTLVAAVCACGRSPKEEPVPKTPAQPIWSAYSGGEEVLRFKEGSGPLRSSAMLPIGATPPIHPFLTATALHATEEGRLRDVLEASKSFPDFIERLKKAGYEVRPGTIAP